MGSCRDGMTLDHGTLCSEYMYRSIPELHDSKDDNITYELEPTMRRMLLIGETEETGLQRSRTTWFDMVSRKETCGP